MKAFTYLFILASLVLACNNDPRSKLETTGNFGQTVTEESTMSVSDAMATPDSMLNKPVKVQGTISNYCKGEGCWLELKNENGKDLFVEIENKAFVLPYKIDNKTAIVSGNLVRNSDDSTTYSVVANGVLIK